MNQLHPLLHLELARMAATERIRDAKSTRGVPHVIAEVAPEVVDRLLELYCDWRTECAKARAAYARIDAAPADEKSMAFDAFEAALDQEQAAAERYGAQITYVGRIARSARPAARAA